MQEVGGEEREKEEGPLICILNSHGQAKQLPAWFRFPAWFRLKLSLRPSPPLLPHLRSETQQVVQVQDVVGVHAATLRDASA